MLTPGHAFRYNWVCTATSLDATKTVPVSIPPIDHRLVLSSSSTPRIPSDSWFIAIPPSSSNLFSSLLLLWIASVPCPFEFFYFFRILGPGISIIRQCVWESEIWYFFQLIIWIINVDCFSLCGYILKMSSSNIRYAFPFLLIDNSIMRLRKRNLEYFRIFSPINYLNYECRLFFFMCANIS